MAVIKLVFVSTWEEGKGGRYWLIDWSLLPCWQRQRKNQDIKNIVKNNDMAGRHLTMYSPNYTKNSTNERKWLKMKTTYINKKKKKKLS